MTRFKTQKPARTLRMKVSVAVGVAASIAAALAVFLKVVPLLQVISVYDHFHRKDCMAVCASAGRDVLLILVATFEYVGAVPDNRDHLAIRELIHEKLMSLGFSANRRTVRIELLPEPIGEISAASGPRSASSIAGKNASVVVWGTIAPNRTSFYIQERLSVDEIRDGFRTTQQIRSYDGRYLNPSLSLPAASDAINLIVTWSIVTALYLDQDFEAASKVIDEALAPINRKMLDGPMYAGPEAL